MSSVLPLLMKKRIKHKISAPEKSEQTNARHQRTDSQRSSDPALGDSSRLRRCLLSNCAHLRLSRRHRRQGSSRRGAVGKATTHSLSLSLITSLTTNLTHYPTHSLTPSLSYSLTHKHSLFHSLNLPLTHSVTHLLTQ